MNKLNFLLTVIVSLCCLEMSACAKCTHSRPHGVRSCCFVRSCCSCRHHHKPDHHHKPQHRNKHKEHKHHPHPCRTFLIHSDGGKVLIAGQAIEDIREAIRARERTSAISKIAAVRTSLRADLARTSSQHLRQAISRSDAHLEIILAALKKGEDKRALVLLDQVIE